MIKTEENCNRRQRIANEESIEVSKTRRKGWRVGIWKNSRKRNDRKGREMECTRE